MEDFLAGVPQNGYTLGDPNAPVTMIADMKRGDTQQVTYQSFGVGGGGQQTVSVTPFISSLRIEVDKQVAWQGGKRIFSDEPPYDEPLSGVRWIYCGYDAKHR